MHDLHFLMFLVILVETLFIGLYVKMSQNAQMQHPPVGSTPIKIVNKLETAEKYLVAEICFQPKKRND